MRSLLILLFALVGAMWVLRVVKRGALRRRTPPPAVPTSQRMVRCRHCGLNVPHDEAVRGGEDFYCSEDHRRGQ